jgi:hypothetical protein
VKAPHDSEASPRGPLVRFAQLAAEFDFPQIRDADETGTMADLQVV